MILKRSWLFLYFYINSQINVGGTTTFDIGNDVNIKGGVINTDRAQGTIGGDVNIESLQDTATYDSKQKNMGFSADLDMTTGKGSSLSVNGGKTDLNADYQAVGEQSGIFTDDGGLDLTAGGKTTLIGGAITTTEAARDAGRNKYDSLGGITTQDIKNTTSYDGDAIQVGVSIGQTNNKPQASMNGLGYGTDSDSDSSVTRAGITGIAGNKDITTENRAEYAGILENSFDAGQVNEELGAQTQITQEFGKEAPKAVGDFASKREETLILNGNVEEAKKWGDGGAYRVALHTLVGAIATGSVEGALSSGTTAVSIPAVRKYLDNQGVDETTKSALLLGLSAGIGATVGGDTASTATSYSQTDNNYLRHNDIQALGEQINKALANGNDAEVRKLLNEAIVRSGTLNDILEDKNIVYVDAISDQPMIVIPKGKIENYLNALNIPAKYQPKVNSILKLQTIGENTYDANRNKFIGKNTEPVYLYPYQAGYGEIPKSYNMSREKVKTIQQDKTRAANAIRGMGNSPSASGAYLGARLSGASDKTAENIAIGVALGANTASSGKGAAFATNKKGAVGVNNVNRKKSVFATSSTNVAKNTETYFRVEGGGSNSKTSQNRVTANSDGTISINSGCAGQLCVSTNGSDHATYFLTEKRTGGNVVVFELNKGLHDFIMKEAVAQNPRYRPIGSDPNAPKIVDPTKSGNSIALELPKIWDSLIQENSSKARVLTQEQYLKEFGK